MAHLDLETGTYAAARTLLGSRDSRRIGHNTTLHTLSGSPDLAVRYHSTDILDMTADGWLRPRTGGWDTSTTWQRINALLPAPWGIGSRNGTRYLYHGGRPITPYADGLAIHPATDAVAFHGDTILTREDVYALRDAADAATEARAVKRAARLLREHPTVGGPRTHTASAYDRRVWGCERCRAEQDAEREARRAALAADHAASDIALGSGPDAWAAYAGAHRNYGGKRACPWDCPNRVGW